MHSIRSHKYRIFIKIIVFLSGVFVMLNILSNVLERKSSYAKYADFFDEKNNFDVLFFGTSHVVDAIFPMELWNDYGMVSYNFGGHGNQMATNYWVLINALDYTSPELVVLDSSCLSANAKTSEISIEQTHGTLDAFPITVNKIYAVNDLFEDSRDKLNFIFKFWAYHDRWSELTSNDFNTKLNVAKGAEYHAKVAIPNEMTIIPKEQKSSIDVLGYKYAEMIIEECQRRGIEVLLTYLPFPALEYKQEEANRTYDLADKYKINYINFLDLDVINFRTDCLDAGSHLNPSGGKKVTDYIGKYIKENYQILDRRGDKRYETWNDDYIEYTEYKFRKLKEQDSLDKYLCIIADKNISCCMYIKENSKILEDERMLEIINNVSIYEETTKFQEAGLNKKDYFMIIDNTDEKIWESVDGTEIDDFETSFARISYKSDLQGNRKLYINDLDYSMIDEKNEYQEDALIVVFDGLSGNIADVAKFTVEENRQYVNASKKE